MRKKGARALLLWMQKEGWASLLQLEVLMQGMRDDLMVLDEMMVEVRNFLLDTS